MRYEEWGGVFLLYWRSKSVRMLSENLEGILVTCKMYKRDDCRIFNVDIFCLLILQELVTMTK